MAGMVVTKSGPCVTAERSLPSAFSPTLCAKALGINYNTILYWVRTKLVRASVRYEARQWAPVLFARDDLVDLCVIKALRSRGASTRRIRRVIALLRRERKRSASLPAFVDASRDDVLALRQPDVTTAVARYPPALVVDVASIEGFVDRALGRLARPAPRCSKSHGALA